MSAIAGVYYRDGRPAASRHMTAMAQALAHRGPDGSGTWQEGPVGLMYRQLQVTPEDQADEQPVHHAPSGITLVADARIDNRDELIRTLEIAPMRGPVITDAEVILKAYLRWGADAPGHLVGAFAFALWDARAQRLALVCDHMAIRPLFFYRTNELIAFATEIKALFCLPEVPRETNDTVIADHLTTVKRRDPYATFYKDIYQFRPAHRMVVTPDQSPYNRYWALDPERRLPEASDEAYVAGFKKRFDEAVRCRLRRTGPVGSTLSGGLDSSSIACTIRDQEWPTGEATHTYSCIFPSLPEETLATIDERVYIEEVTQQPGIEAHLVRADEYSPLVDVDRMLWHLDDGFWGANVYLHWLMFQRATTDGVRLFFDGSDGDSVISHGFGRLAELIHQGRWDVFDREVNALTARYEAPPEQLARKFGYPEVRWLVREGPRRKIVPVLHALHSRFGIPYREMLMGPVLRTVLPEDLRQGLGLTGLPTEAPTIIAEAFARSQRIPLGADTGFLEYETLDTGTGPNHRVGQVEGLQGPEFTTLLNLADKLSGAHQVQEVYPFFDRRLMEYCVALPAHLKLRDGWRRYVLRRGMEGVLPKAIQWRADKGRLGGNFARNLFRFDGEALQDMIGDQHAALQPFVNVDVVRKLIAKEATAGQPNMRNATAVYAVYMLSRWMAKEEQAGRSFSSALPPRVPPGSSATVP